MHGGSGVAAFAATRSGIVVLVLLSGLRRLAVFTRSLSTDPPLLLLLLMDVTGSDIEGGDNDAMIGPSPEEEEGVGGPSGTRRRASH